VILGFAAVQLVVHMIYFLHMNSKSEGGWNMMALILTVILLFIVLTGSIWVMYHMNANMMPEYRRVQATGTFLHERETLVQAVSDLGSGFWVMTPLQLTDGTTLLVNRGFVSQERRDRATRSANDPIGETTITGLLRVTQPKGGFLQTNDPAADRWYSRDVEAIAAARGLSRAAPYFVDADAAPVLSQQKPAELRLPEARVVESRQAETVWPVGGLTVISFQNNHLVSGHKNMLQLIELRWIAVIGQVTTIAGAILVFDVAPAAGADARGAGLPDRLQHRQPPALARTPPRHQQRAVPGLLVDVASLTMQLYLSGGTTNPFAFLYLLQVILSAVLLEAWSTWTIVGITLACLAGLSIFAKPLALPFDHARGISSLYVQGMLICFVLNAALLVVFISRISTTLRARRPSWPTCASAPPRKSTSCAWACWPRAPPTNWARRWRPVGDPGRLEAHARIQAEPRPDRRNHRNAGPAQALQVDRQRHPAVGRRGARRVGGAHHHPHLPGRPGRGMGTSRPVREFVYDNRIGTTCRWPSIRPSSR
jgi:cytochrome oxidase assembly protein ShyY1